VVTFDLDITPLTTHALGGAIEEVSSRQSAEWDDDESWLEVASVQAQVVRHLAANGWDITRVADTESREHGVDIEARSGLDRILVEVKGFPSSTYVRGSGAGEPKRFGRGAQARTYFSNAALAGLLMRSEHPNSRVVLAFPSRDTY
jgi:hypothetical protein